MQHVPSVCRRLICLLLSPKRPLLGVGAALLQRLRDPWKCHLYLSRVLVFVVGGGTLWRPVESVRDVSSRLLVRMLQNALICWQTARFDHDSDATRCERYVPRGRNLSLFISSVAHGHDCGHATRANKELCARVVPIPAARASCDPSRYCSLEASSFALCTSVLHCIMHVGPVRSDRAAVARCQFIEYRVKLASPPRTRAHAQNVECSALWRGLDFSHLPVHRWWMQGF
jgi:hypothetical protein